MIFGAGKIGRSLRPILKHSGYEIVAYIDNNENIWGDSIHGIPIINLDTYKEKYSDLVIYVAISSKFYDSVEKQLIENECRFVRVDMSRLMESRERLISYSHPNDREDVILYNALCDEKEIFYIDVGSNDPFLQSVTKLLYDMKNAHGINLEPQENLYKITLKERPRDITLCVGVGEKEDTMTLYIQSGLSTVVAENVVSSCNDKKEIPITTLKNVCDEYVKDKIITFLKIDVEGFEKSVLLGADFSKYRPKIIVMESTLPGTDIPCHEEWEDILLSNNYHFVYSYGVNRYYVADEYSEYDVKFNDMDDIEGKYQLIFVHDKWYS